MMKFIEKRSILIVCTMLVVLIITTACEKDKVISDASFPLGRTSVLNNHFDVITNSRELTYEMVYDNCGGYWLNFNAEQLEDDTEVVIKFTCTSQPTDDFIDNKHLDNWLTDSHYIDCNKNAIKSKALEITEGSNSNMEKALEIHKYVIEHLEFYEDYHKPADVKASKTLEEGKGVCMNFSRLYVALCRAAAVPARTVWGVVYADFDETYYYHHQWAEVCDEDGKWHICDLTKRKEFFNNDIEYLDLVYGAEENSTITGNKNWIHLINEIDYWHKYPVAHLGKIPGFELIANEKPDSLVVEYAIQF